MKLPYVSIIIPYPKDNPYLQECLKHCLSLDYPYYEIILLPDAEETHQEPHVRVIPTGKIGPSEKRDIGIKQAKGEIVAFLDDDTYPVPEWLKNGVKHFQDPAIAAVGGPAVTPLDDGFLEQASGAIYASSLVSGKYTYRYIPQKGRYVDDYPSCNLLVRRKVMEEIGGFDSRYYPGEDTVICLKIVRDLKMKIYYEPRAQVFHHRRKVFQPHLRQIKNYALHRGNFVKKFPETSFRLSYFIPSLFTLGLSLGWMSGFFSTTLFRWYGLGVAFYVGILLAKVFLLKEQQLRKPVFFGIVATHVTYGFWFIVGLLVHRMPEEKKSAIPVPEGELK